MVQKRIAPRRRHNPERDADADRNQHGNQCKLDGCGQARQQVFRNRARGEEAGAEVTLEEMIVVVEQLHEQWTVEAELAAQDLDSLAAGRLSRKQCSRVGWNYAGDEEHDRNQTRRGWHEPDETFANEGEDAHRAVTSPPCGSIEEERRSRYS